MAIRVSNNMLYQGFTDSLNSSLNDLIDLNIQSQTQKRINKPSDDPVGTERVLGIRDSLRAIEQYSNNITTATGWLNLSDNTLTQLSSILSETRGLAEQAATGTLSADNREQISYQVRQLFEQVVGLANTRYNGQSLYAGHKTDQAAFVEKLWMTTNDSALANRSFTIEGSADKTVLVQFPGTTGNTATLAAGSTFRYSTDGGSTFQTGTVTQNGSNLVMLMGGVQMTLDNSTPITVRETDQLNTNDSTGTWMWVRPTAQYVGDDQDSTAVDQVGVNPAGVSSRADGNFSKNVMVRVDSATTLDGEIDYSYSVDGGSNWTTGNKVRADTTASNAILPIPGGVLVLSNTSATTFGQLSAGSQFVVRPRVAAINLQVSWSESVRINDIGKDVFGGVYQGPGASGASPVYGTGSMVLGSNAALASNSASAKNLFETLGNLVAFLETNNQQGIQECLAKLKTSQAYILNCAASVGGRENRLTVAQNLMNQLEDTQNSELSRIEDVDLAELMTKLSQKQVVYETVLKSTSMIMKMSLMDYL